MAAIGNLGQWLNGKSGWGKPATADVVMPPGDGPLVLFVDETGPLPAFLRRRRPGLRLAGINSRATGVTQVAPDVPADLAQARAVIERLKPSAVLLAGGTVPPALVAVCDDADIPVTLLADRHQIAAAAARTAWSGLRRGPLTRLSRVMVPDRPAHDAAMRAGIAPQRIEVIGRAAPVVPPMRCNMREHAALRPMLANRHVWLAAGLPAIEAPAIMAAQRAVLSSYHRALLIVAPAQTQDAHAIGAAAVTAGLSIARRDDDEEPLPDVQVLVAEDSAELGLWYRLAPVTYMGGTLIASAAMPRHPYEPAGLGSAIVHGQHLPEHAELWRGLGNAGGARRVRNAVQLGIAIEELGSPEVTARLAQAAWQVATAGAEITRTVADALLSDLPGGAA